MNNPIRAFGTTIVYMLAGMGLLYMFQILGITSTLVTSQETQQVAQASYDQGYTDAIMPFDKNGNTRKSAIKGK